MMITWIKKTITQIRFGKGNGQGNEARIGKGYGDVAVAVTETGIVTFAVAVTKVNLCNLLFDLCNHFLFLSSFKIWFKSRKISRTEATNPKIKNKTVHQG